MIDVDMLVDMDGIGQLVGTVNGIFDATDSARYVDSLAHAAHGKASMEFDIAAAASAGAGYLTHVYEYGVNGITRGTGGVADPTSPAARLWTHSMTGGGGHYDIGFNFRPAMVPNPAPTTAATGVPSKYLKKISRRKYIFRNRAFVMETGMEVEIAPKRGRFLFVPFYGDPGPNGRGYMMWDAERLGPLHNIPGRNTAGTFTRFWKGWWSTRGVPQMQTDIRTHVNMDVQRALAEASARSKAPEPVRAETAAAQMRKVALAAQKRAASRATASATAKRGEDRK